MCWVIGSQLVRMKIKQVIVEGDFSANFHLTHALGAVHYTMMTVDTVSIVSDGFSTWLAFSRQHRLLVLNISRVAFGK